MREGIGLCAPRPVDFLIDLGAMRLLFEESEKRARYRCYVRGGEWERGLKRETSIPGVGLILQDVRPILAGLVAEYAVDYSLGLRFGQRNRCINLGLEKYGDGGVDLTYFGVAIQVKNRQSRRVGNLVRVKSENGQPVIPTAGIWVFCEWLGGMNVSILGWCLRARLLTLPVVPAIRGKHKNVSPPDDSLEPFSGLLDELSAHKGLKDGADSLPRL